MAVLNTLGPNIYKKHLREKTYIQPKRNRDTIGSVSERDIYRQSILYGINAKITMITMILNA